MVELLWITEPWFWFGLVGSLRASGRRRWGSGRDSGRFGPPGGDPGGGQPAGTARSRIGRPRGRPPLSYRSRSPSRPGSGPTISCRFPLRGGFEAVEDPSADHGDLRLDEARAHRIGKFNPSPSLLEKCESVSGPRTRPARDSMPMVQSTGPDPMGVQDVAWKGMW